MYYGYIESESLKNPLILNRYKKVKIEIEYVPTSQNYPYVHAYYLKFTEQEILKEVKKFSKEIKPEWYALFWDNKTVFAIFSNKVFTLPNEGNWRSDAYKEIQQYGVTHGIGLEYMDFNKNLKRFYQTLANKK